VYELKLENSKGVGKCLSCNRDGFLWGRNYCSYCGFIDLSFSAVDLDVARAEKDDLYDKELRKGFAARTIQNSETNTHLGDRFYSSSDLGI
jgi:hypothetical protein